MRFVVAALLFVTGCRIGFDARDDLQAQDGDVVDSPDAASCVDTACVAPLLCSPETLTCTPPTSFSIGGTATLGPGTLEISNLGGDSLSITQSGDFVFAMQLEDGAPYEVLVTQEPLDTACTLSNGSGTVASANVIDIVIECVPNASALGIRCGSDTCDQATQRCCHDETGPGGQCAPIAGGCANMQVAMPCDDPSDCGVGNSCCTHFDNGGELKPVQCEAACTQMGNLTTVELCIPVTPDTCSAGSCQFSADYNFFYCQ